jgi:TolB-like protein/tetratricopeptide (TPR) repeat protein
VTDFVNALQEELAATIKEPLSIYFDKNPHDGLLETHNVDKSLEGKLKCLIFIPIISQTYCDPKSFAWQHEFVAFNKLAQDDPLGRDIKLSNGNVASRILPIRIHDLDAEDKSIIENEIGGALRSLEFTFNSVGVSRALTAADKRDENSNKTLYRDQINKVARAIKELFGGVQHSKDLPKGVSNHQRVTAAKHGTKKTAWVAAIILLLGLVSFGLYYLSGFGNKGALGIDRSIAVLPFVDMSPGKDQEYLGDGIAEDIITELSRIKGLKVIGRTSSFQFKGEKIDLRDLGEKLNVSSVLEGSVMKSGNKIRITAQLINVSDGAHIWAEHYDKPMDDIFAIHDQISRAISDKMKVSLLGNHNRSERKPTSNTEAFENYLRGKQILRPGRGNEAMPFFEKAIQLDSGYADAYASLAWCYFFSRRGDLPETFDRMLPLALKVLELDPESEKSHSLLYSIYATYKWDWKTANDEYQKYLSIKPIPPIGHALDKAWIMGDVKGGIEELKQQLEVDPINKDVLRLLGQLYATDKQFANAKELINKVIEMDPSFEIAYWALAGVNVMAGEYDLALQNLAKLDEFDKGKSFDTKPLRMWALVKAGRVDGAKKIYATMDLSKPEGSEYGPESGLDPASKAKIEFWMGHVDEGFRWLEKAFDQKEWDVLTIRFNPQFDVIRNHPRFKEFIKKVPFPPNN